jgi:hypothetical protein
MALDAIYRHVEEDASMAAHALLHHFAPAPLITSQAIGVKYECVTLSLPQTMV